ncbi:MAG: T9SS type A sorting domain-containing protein [Lewinellaceae bacterium]|nr:T9SS type A sorting domain-containing protein [Lewinellaceae bacterium]
MNIKFQLLIFALLFFYKGYIWSQPPQLEWAKQTGSITKDWGKEIKLDAAGNIFILGQFSGTVDFDPGPNTYDLTSNGDMDIFIQKLDPDGNFVWAKSLGNEMTDFPYAMGVGPDGNVVAVGSFQGTVDFDPGPGERLLSSEGSLDIFVLALEWNGDYLWAESIGGPGLDEATSVSIDCNVHALIAGHFEETVDFKPGAGTCYLTSAGGTDIFVAELDCSGNFIRAYSMGGPGNDGATGLAVDAEGNHFTTGYFQNTADFDPDAGTYELTSNGMTDVFIQKFNINGHFQWARSIGGLYSDLGRVIKMDILGNVVIAGNFDRVVDFDPGPGEWPLGKEENDGSLFLLRLSPEGEFAGAIALVQQNGNITPLSLAIEESGNNYLAGFFSSMVDFDPGPGEEMLTASGSEDMFLMKLDPLGALLWVRQIGGQQNDLCTSLFLDTDQNLFFTGSFEETADFDPGTGVFDLTSAGGSDLFTAKWAVSTVAASDRALPTPVALFPNPTTGRFTLDLGSTYQEVTIEVMNTSGQVIQRQQLEQVQTLYLYLEQPPGLYFVKIQDKKGRQMTGMVSLVY